MSPRADRPVLRRVRRWSLAAGGPLILLTGLSFLGARHWAFELLTHFRLQLAAGSVFLLAVALLLRQWRVAVMLGIVALANGLPLAAYLLRTPIGEAQAAARGSETLQLTVGYHNMRNRSADFEALFAHLRQAEPDVLVLTEMDYRRRADLFHALRPRFRYFASTPGPGIFNVAVFSRFPLTEVKRMLNTANDWPMLHVRVCPEEGRHCLRVVALHAHPPIGRWAGVRNAAMEEAALEARSGEGPVIVVGDLNCSPWSPQFREMLDLGGLRDANRAGLTGTWGSRSPFLGLLIDHLLVGPGVREKARRIGPAFGSDHFMLTADLEFAAPAVAATDATP